MKNIIATIVGALLSAGFVAALWIVTPKGHRYVDFVSPADPFPRYVPKVDQGIPSWMIIVTVVICVVVPILTYFILSHLILKDEEKIEEDGWSDFFLFTIFFTCLPCFIMSIFGAFWMELNSEDTRPSITHQWADERYGIDLEDTVFFRDLDSVKDENGKKYYVELTNEGYILVDKNKEEIQVRL